MLNAELNHFLTFAFTHPTKLRALKSECLVGDGWSDFPGAPMSLSLIGTGVAELDAGGKLLETEELDAGALRIGLLEADVLATGMLEGGVLAVGVLEVDNSTITLVGVGDSVSVTVTVTGD